MKGEDIMFNFLDIAPVEPVVSKSIFDKEITVGLAIGVALVIVITVVLLSRKKKK